ncbi:MAG: cyclic nucleotide-binding protein [Alphaproteobacteria bacterium]|nr:cyclic nucleotide-binding protein [Alphaproteobacteria bacterium]
MEFYDSVGIAGVVVLLVSYFLLQINKLTVDGILYSLLNILAAVLVLYSLIYDFNLPSFLIQISWILISFVGIFRTLIKRKNANKPINS